ncbi:MAG: lysophospholipid acyltransferase family protein [Pseudomonadota bacterium]|nr:lysophospholipid acyltransferase family protein [Pseudomonadota bacterium]
MTIKTNQTKTKPNKTTPYHGKRQLSLGRRIYYFFGLLALKLLIKLLTSTYKLEILDQNDVITSLIKNKKVYAPCYWHQHSLVCLTVVSKWLKKGFRGGFIVSPSVDGEVPAKIAKSWGAVVIRGSAVRTGATAMREIHTAMKNGVSIVTAADGPLGPKYQFKSGVALMAKLSSAPIVPLSCATNSSWQLKRWDQFMIPKPFAHIVLSVGDPYEIPKDLTLNELEEHRVRIEDSMNKLMNRTYKITHDKE